VNKEYYNCKTRTAGLLVAYRSCGYISNFSEMITGEGLIQSANLIENTNQFGEIKNVCYDNGCHLDKHVNNKSYSYEIQTKEIKFFIDRFHIKNHNKSCVKYSCDNDSIVKKINSSVCEQQFYTLGKFKYISEHMSKLHFNFFYMMIFECLNKKNKD
jgi:hypothetical protein